MLTTQERLRIEDKLVVPYEVTWREYSTTYEPKLVWVGADTDTISDSEFTSYPAIIAEFDSRGDIVDAEDPVNNLVERVFDENEDAIRETRERPQTDSLSLTVAVSTSFDETVTPAGEMGVPPQVRAEDIMRGVWEWVNFHANSDLNNWGDNGERPMTVEPTASPTPSRVQDTVRMQCSVELQHTVTVDHLLEYADDTDLDATVQ